MRGRCRQRCGLALTDPRPKQQLMTGPRFARPAVRQGMQRLTGEEKPMMKVRAKTKMKTNTRPKTMTKLMNSTSAPENLGSLGRFLYL